MSYSGIDKIIIALDGVALPYKVASALIDSFGEKLLSLEQIKNEVIKAVGEETYIKLKNAISDKNIEKTISKLEKYRVKAVTIKDDDYPETLKNIAFPPLVIYYRGDVSLLKKRSIAIVGTRKPTSYGREVTKLFSSELSRSGLVTVSGLAYGLDMEVAMATLEARGKTIAVLGGGLDKIYPSQNSQLSEKIVESGGVLISLLPPEKRPTKYSFIDRNRIISGLSEGTIIIEAGTHSGTLNTANHAIEQGKELFVVPANITSLASAGSNKLIEELPETFTISPDRVLKVLKIEKKAEESKKKSAENGEDEKLILKLLYERDLDFDTLLEKTGIESKLLIRRLTTMEISGLIKKLPNNIYSLCG